MFKSTPIAIATSIALLFVASAAAIAAVPDSDGVIHACLAKTGTLRLIDTEAGGACSRGEKALNWNERGVAGPVGPQGAPGPQGEPGPQGAPGPQGEPADLSSVAAQLDALSARIVALEQAVADLSANQQPPDGDSDGIADSVDNCVDTANPDQANRDGDARGDACDPFPDDPFDGVNCDDGDPATIDVFNPLTGMCSHDPVDP